MLCRGNGLIPIGPLVIMQCTCSYEPRQRLGQPTPLRPAPPLSHVEQKQCSGVLPDCQCSELILQRSLIFQLRRGSVAILQEMLQSVKLTENV